jgi:hypothetical protein
MRYFLKRKYNLLRHESYGCSDKLQALNLWKVSKGESNQQGLLRTLTVFGCVSLTRGCVSSSFVSADCVSVLLHFSLHAFALLCALLHCYMVLLECCYIKGCVSGHPVQILLLERNKKNPANWNVTSHLSPGLRLCLFAHVRQGTKSGHIVRWRSRVAK